MTEASATSMRRPVRLAVGAGLAGLFCVFGYGFILLGGGDSSRSWQDYQGDVQTVSVDSKHTFVKSETSSQATYRDGYTDGQNCYGCHREQYEGYLTTTHANSAHLATEDASAAGGSFVHSISRRKYEVYFRDGWMHHQETMVDANGKALFERDVPIDIGIGSGTHGVTYLFNRDGHWFESPLTWYAEEDGYAMSPGYDNEKHQSFNRSANDACVFCHVGQIERVEENPRRYRIAELTIGCQRCHGPGDKHVEIYRAVDGMNESDRRDYLREHSSEDQIVHPATLDRIASEAICQQCHLQGITTVSHAGENIWDFRPGNTMVEHRSDYRFADEVTSRVVGHVEQMHLSKCYLESDSLSCITCHNPHFQPGADEKLAYFRDACYQCHEDERCGVEHQDRVTKNGNDCSACHMPKAETDIVHAALHNHQIGIFDESGNLVTPNQVDKSADLVEQVIMPILDDSSLSDDERERRRGHALYQALLNSDRPEFVRSAVQKYAAGLMSKVQRGQADPELKSVLAELMYYSGSPSMAMNMYRGVVGRLAGESYRGAAARQVMATLAAASGQHKEAINHYRILTKNRVKADDFYAMAISQRSLYRVDDAIDSLRNALEIEPAHMASHELLAELLRDTDPRLSEEHRRIAGAISE
ncbi:MAG: tetratricopeptide repeat protein [Planctomycetota bacterium]